MSYKIKQDGLEVKTNDGKNIMGQDFSVEIKELDTKSRTFVAIGSTENPDRSNDVVRIEGWDLKRYKKAPRGLWAHDYRSLPIFKSQKTWIDKEKKQLLFQPEFDVHDFANLIFNQYQNGFLSDFSVGFIAHESKFRDENDRWAGGLEFTKHELLEISSVPVPDNPEAQKLGLGNSDIPNLIKLGYKTDFDFDEKTGLFWNPINLNLEAYKEPKLIHITNGVKAVNAIPIFDNERIQVVGYFFDSNIYDKDKINNWIKENAPVKPKIYFYNVIDSDENFTLSIDEKLLDTSSIPSPDNVSDSLDDELIIISASDKMCKCPKCGKEQKLGDSESCSSIECSDCKVSMEDSNKKGEDEEEEGEEEEKICVGCGKPKKECGCGNKKEVILLFPDEIYEAKDFYEKPYPNEHACRLNDPSKYDKFARKNCAQKHGDKCIDVIYGIKDGKSEIQAYRYKKDVWTEESAKTHCNSHNGNFEAASDKMNTIIIGKYYDKDGNEINLEEIKKNFDKDNDDSVKVLFETLISKIEGLEVSIEEIKKNIYVNKETFKEDEDLISIDPNEFPPVSQKDHNLIEIGIESLEDMQALVSESVNTDIMEQKMLEIFDDLLKKD